MVCGKIMGTLHNFAYAVAVYVDFLSPNVGLSKSKKCILSTFKPFYHIW